MSNVIRKGDRLREHGGKVREKRQRLDHMRFTAPSTLDEEE
ncbi:hypothetical protein [Serratia plymuthica]|nr:hypothetical protein [Serratia plymuthica]